MPCFDLELNFAVDQVEARFTSTQYWETAACCFDLLQSKLETKAGVSIFYFRNFGFTFVAFI